jgi:hypothetical protein
MAEGDISLYTQPSEIHTWNASEGFPEWLESGSCVHREAGTDGILFQLFYDLDTFLNGYSGSTSLALVRYDIATRTYIDFNILGGTIPTDFVGSGLSINYIPSLDKIAIAWRTRDVGGGTYQYHFSYISESGGTWTVNNTVSATARANNEAQTADFCEYVLATSSRLFMGGVSREFTQPSGNNQFRFYLAELTAGGITLVCDGEQLPTGTGTISTSSIDLKRGRVTDTYSSFFMHQVSTGTGKLFEIRVPDDITAFADITIAEIWEEPDYDGTATFGRFEDVFWDEDTDHVFLWRGNAPTDGSQSLLKKIDLGAQTVAWTVTHDNFWTGRYDTEKRLPQNGITGCTMLCSGFGAHDGNSSTRRNYVLNLEDGSLSKIHAYGFEYFNASHETGNFSSDGFAGFYDIANSWIVMTKRLSNSNWKDTQHVDLGSNALFQILEIETDMFYPNGACGGAEAGPNWQNVCFLNPIERV